MSRQHLAGLDRFRRNLRKRPTGSALVFLRLRLNDWAQLPYDGDAGGTAFGMSGIT